MNFETMKQANLGVPPTSNMRGRDAGVVEGGGGAGLGKVGVSVPRLAGEDQPGVRHLDRDLTLQLLVAGQEDAAKATLVERQAARSGSGRRATGGRQE